jgi:hypothetical protein
MDLSSVRRSPNALSRSAAQFEKVHRDYAEGVRAALEMKLKGVAAD